MNEKFELNLSHLRSQSQPSLAISWCVTAFVAFFCVVLATASQGVVRPFDALFQGLGVDVPWPTHFLLATYFWLLPLFYLSLAVFAIAVQSSNRDFRTKRLTTVRIFLAMIVSVALVVFILYLPLLTVASKLNDTK